MLRHLALHDPLTDLANRTLLVERLRSALANGRRDQTTTALLVVDLDRFKDINDQLGHDVGDVVLVTLASRMQMTVRDVDTVARSGGDEFTVVLPAAGIEADVLDVARRLVDALRDPIDHDGEVIMAGGSVGVALAPAHGDDPETLFRHADAAMYRAKGSATGLAVHGAADADTQP